MQIPQENEDPRIHASRACSSRPRRARIWGFLGTLGKSARPVGGALAPVLLSCFDARRMCSLFTLGSVTSAGQDSYRRERRKCLGIG